jgi:hypothetical protein
MASPLLNKLANLMLNYIYFQFSISITKNYSKAIFQYLPAIWSVDSAVIRSVSGKNKSLARYDKSSLQSLLKYMGWRVSIAHSTRRRRI